jgi:hypothetical protein
MRIVFISSVKFLLGVLEQLQDMNLEIRDFPFPRSKEAISVSAAPRGASSGFKAANAFEMSFEVS